MIAALALAALVYVSPAPVWTPGPSDPVCEVGQSEQVDHCAQGQLPGEVIGREVDAPPAPARVVDPASIVLAPTVPATVVPAPARHLAHTGVATAPYLAAAAGMIGGGVLLRRRVTAMTTHRPAD